MHNDVPQAVIRAAEARAQGSSWPVAAEKSGWELPGLRAWIDRHQQQWAREYGRARREAHDTAGDEAVTVLRRKLRDEESKTVLAAATALAGRFAAKKGKPRAAPARNETDGMDDWLATLSDDQLGRITAHMEIGSDADEGTAPAGNEAG
jgi:hypothetical protein